MNRSSMPSVALPSVALLSVAIGAALVLSATHPAQAGEFRTVDNPIQGQYLVVLKADAAALASESGKRPRVAAVANTVAAAHGARVVRSYQNALRGFVARADDAALARLLADPRVDFVEEDGRVRISATQSGATWGIDRVDQRDLPLSGTYTYDTAAAGTHAYIIDTGMLASHSQFSGRVGNGYTAIDDGNGTSDCNGHGTHVAGTVGGTTYGVAKGTTLHPVRVLGCDGSGSWSGVIAGMDWVGANHVKPAVANMSLGGGASSAIDTAVANLTNAGVTVVVAAGNQAADACSYSPARAPAAITVGATTSTDARSSFSNYGSCLDLFAPGSAILSSWNSGTTATNTLNGTSMASPHVAGAAALYLASNPTATPAQVTSALLNGATPGKVTGAGTGSPNRLLYSRASAGGGSPPTISNLLCPDYNNSGGNTYWCEVTFASTTPATVSWTGGSGTAMGSSFYGRCTTGTQLRVTATVTNASGSVSATSASFACPSGPIP